MQFPYIHAHQKQLDALHYRAMMAKPMTFETMEIVVEVATHLHLELRIGMCGALEMPCSTHEATQLLYCMTLLILVKFV